MSLIYNATFDKNTRKLSFEDKAGNEIYSCTIPERAPMVDDITKPLTFRATQDGSTIRIEKYGRPDGDFQTSTDGGNTWVDYSIGRRINLNTGDEVSFRVKKDRSPYQYSSDYPYFVMGGKIEAWHNVMSMYRANDFDTYDTAVGSLFSYLFKDCTSLTKAPVLPATTLANDSCYYRMFEGCQSLTKAPELPATTLVPNCYGGMFSGCQSLTKAPELPATTLAFNCYYSMFNGCQSLTKAPELPATTLASSCYANMFSGCQSLTKAPVLPATTLASNCYNNMFSGCQSLKEVRIAATTTATDALKDWLSGVSATGDFYCYPIATIFPSDSASGIPANWTRIPKPASAVDDITKPLTLRAIQDGSTVKLRKNGSPTGDLQTSRDGGNTWTDYTIDTTITLNIGDEVSFRAKADRSAQILRNYFQFKMTGKIEAWHNVMSLYRTNDFATYDTVVDYAFQWLFEGCTSLTKAPVLPATTLSDSCYWSMFYGCESLTKAPELPATTLAVDCYYQMFEGCQSLKEVRVSATATDPTATNALSRWLSRVSATGDFYCDPNAKIFPTGVSGIPQNWTRHALSDYPVTP